MGQNAPFLNQGSSFGSISVSLSCSLLQLRSICYNSSIGSHQVVWDTGLGSKQRRIAATFWSGKEIEGFTALPELPTAITCRALAMWPWVCIGIHTHSSQQGPWGFAFLLVNPILLHKGKLLISVLVYSFVFPPNSCEVQCALSSCRYFWELRGFGAVHSGSLMGAWEPTACKLPSGEINLMS